MLDATHHILNNFLQKMMRIREAAEDSSDFDEQALRIYDQIIEETTAQIR